MKFLLPVFLLIAVLTPGGLVQAQDPISHGQSLVAEFCARCHAVGVKGESPYPLAPPFRTLGRIV
ncbi:MAG: cytochrome c, partial [Pseudolabrys sp.]